MGKTSSGLIYPTIEDIKEINFKQIHKTGGDIDGAGKLIKEDALRWALETIQYPPFSQYQTISEKAATLGWTIIQSHVFIDGNKRTGINAIMNFLIINGFYLKASDEHIIEIAIKVAMANTVGYTKEEFINWIHRHLTLLLPPSY